MSKSRILSLVFLTAIACGRVSPADTLYGVTASSLVTVNPDSGAATLVGSLGLGLNQTPGPLAWNPTDGQLYGFVYDFTVSGSTVNILQQRFVRIDPTTASVSSLATFGPQDGTGITYDAIEYVGGTVNSLVVSRSATPGNTSSTQLATITTAGVTATLRDTSLDNDLLAQSASPSVLVSIDPNNQNPALQARTVDLTPNPATETALTGSLPSGTTGELAYDASSGKLYALDYDLAPTPNHNLYRLGLNAETLSLEATTVTSGDQLRGIAFAAVPEPRETALLAGITLLAWRLRRRST